MQQRSSPEAGRAIHHLQCQWSRACAYGSTCTHRGPPAPSPTVHSCTVGAAGAAVDTAHGMHSQQSPAAPPLSPGLAPAGVTDMMPSSTTVISVLVQLALHRLTMQLCQKHRQLMLLLHWVIRSAAAVSALGLLCVLLLEVLLLCATKPGAVSYRLCLLILASQMWWSTCPCPLAATSQHG
jgi:hypothetical protein